MTDAITATGDVQEGRATRFKPLLFIAGVFLLGAVAGGGAARAYTVSQDKPWYGASPEERVQIRANAMKRQLDLSDDQTKTVAKILRESDGEREKVMEPCRPGLDALRERNNSRIREVLNGSQRQKFEALALRASPTNVTSLSSSRLADIPLSVVPSHLPEVPTALPTSLPEVPSALPDLKLPDLKPSALPDLTPPELPPIPTALPGMTTGV